MSSVLVSRRTAAYKPELAWFAAIGGAWVFVLVTLGAFTTSIGAGMVFPDWPLSNGSVNPEGWLSDIAMFAEHSHRLSAGLMSLITIAIAVWVWRSEERGWVRHLAFGAVALVLAQALVGGLRVLLDHLHVEMVNTSVGRLFAMLHAVMAQVYVCTILAVALALSRPWTHGAVPAAPSSWRNVGRLCVGLLVVQLAVAAVMRHSFAGLAIWTFPWSTPDGGLLPAEWDFRVGIHLAHRFMAVVLTAALVWFTITIWRDRSTSAPVKQTSLLMLGLLALQIALGAAAVLTQRSPGYTTAHVIVGAALLALTFGLTCWGHRFQPAPPPPKLPSEPVLSLRRR
ncbi:MAG TPA: COX15/CtaA family protein [Opitutaceae bacterium]